MTFYAAQATFIIRDVRSEAEAHEAWARIADQSGFERIMFSGALEGQPTLEERVRALEG